MGNLYFFFRFSSSQCPTFKREGDGTETPEPFAAEARFFTESRLLQRDVQIILESCPNQIILGTILHPVKHRNQYLVVTLLILGFSFYSFWFFLTVLIWFCLRMVTSQNSCWKKGLHAVWTGPWLFTPRELKNSELLNGTQQKIHFDTSQIQFNQLFLVFSSQLDISSHLIKSYLLISD